MAHLESVAARKEHDSARVEDRPAEPFVIGRHQGEVEMPTFAEIATTDAESRFNILVAAAGFVDAQVPGSNLISTLSDANQSLTVFAPTDMAFGQLAAELGFGGDVEDEDAVTGFLTGLGAATLNDVILYHVVGQPLTAAQIANAGSVQPLSGPTINADLPVLVDAEPDLIDPSVIQADIMADNGVLHVVDRVLLPVDFPGNDAATIAGLVAASGAGFDDNSQDFDILLEAVSIAGLVGALNEATSDLTVFAPFDGAFIGLAQALGYADTEEEGAWTYLVDALTLLGRGDPLPLLTEILTYHVAGESLQASQVLSAPNGVQTLQGGIITFDGVSIVDADSEVPNPMIAATDIQAANGIVHGIDGVLIPADLLVSDGSGDVDFIIDGNNSSSFNLGDDNDFFYGKGGSDSVFSGSGNDFVLGGTGADFAFAGSGHDTLNGEDGNDRFFGGTGQDNVMGGSGDDQVGGGSGDDTVDGGDGHDFLFGGSENDILLGAGGNDMGLGGSGNDSVFSGDGDDAMFGGSEDDIVGGGDGDDTIGGGDGNDTLYGGQGNDHIYGGGGDDIIFVGDGQNGVYGGSGRDTFVIGRQKSFVRIEDFNDGVDLIDVQAFGFSDFADIQAIAQGNDNLTFIDLGDASFSLRGFNVENLSADDFLL